MYTKYSLSLFLFLTMVCLFLIGCRSNAKQGSETPDLLIERLVDSVNEQDSKEITSMIVSGYNASDEISSLLSSYENFSVSTHSVNYLETENPNFLEAEVILESSIPMESEFSETFYLQRVNGLWYFVMGKPPK